MQLIIKAYIILLNLFYTYIFNNVIDFLCNWILKQLRASSSELEQALDKCEVGGLNLP